VTDKLVIAPEWLGRSGLWLIDAKGKRKPVDAEDIGLSDVLADRLESWMDSFDAIYDETNETASDFGNAVERLAWEAEGAALAEAIIGELGTNWDVTQDLNGWRGKATR
jgi:hypothetical protein